MKLKHKYLKFIKNHPSGAFDKDDVIMIPDTSLKAYLASGTVEESIKKAYEDFKADKATKIAKDAKEANKKHLEKGEDSAPNHTGQDPNPEVDDDEETEDGENKDGEESGNGKATGNESNDTGNDSKDGGDGSAPNTEGNKGDGPFYYTLTANDIEQNSDSKLCEGFKVGDEIEVNDQDVWLLGEDDKLIKK